MIKQLRKILLILFSSWSVLAMAQIPRIESIKIFKDRKESEVKAIYQDVNGYIWISTVNGLLQYDGINFQAFLAYTNLTESKATCMISDTSNILWIGDESGKISLFDGKHFTAFDPEEGMGERAISSFYRDKTGTIWFSTLGEGVYYYSGQMRKRLYNLNIDDGLPDNYVYSIIQDDKGLFYFATDKGIAIYNHELDSIVGKISMSDGLPDNIVKQLNITGDNLWIAMEDGGVTVYNLPKKVFEKHPNWTYGSLQDMIVISPSEAWLATKRHGLVRCIIGKNGKLNFQAITKDDGLIDNRISAVFADFEGNIWIGTQSGLNIRRNNYLEFFQFDDENSIGQIYSITADSSNNLWLASQSGLYKLQSNDDGCWSYIKLFKGMSWANSAFISIYTDKNGFIWAGTYGMGVLKIDPSSFKFEEFSTKQGLCDDNIIHITGLGSKLWFASLGGGVSEVSNESFSSIKNFNISNGLPSSYVYYTYLQAEDTAWLATDGGGLVKIAGDSIIKISTPLLDSIGNVVYSVGKHENTMWLSLADYGLLGYSPDSSMHINAMNMLLSNNVQSMKLLPNDKLLVVSDMGFSLIDCGDYGVQSFGEEAGVAYLQPNLNSIYTDSQGNTYVGAAKGIVKLLPGITEPFVNPELFIDRIRLFNEPVNAKLDQFKYNQNYLTFDYLSLSYTSSINPLYRVKLEGYDMDWREETMVRTVSYSNLPPGKYTFIVQTKLPNGKWFQTKDSEYHFKVRPPFWKTSWFITLSIVLGAVAVYLFIYLRTRKLKHDKEVLELEVRKRTAEIHQQKEEIEAQRDEIEAQRNHVMEQRDRIEEQNKDIKASIQYASRIQNAVLPPLENFEKYFTDHFVFFRPRDIVSGDFFYLNVIHQKVVVAAADCTGHGVPGALMSILGMSLLNQIIITLPVDFTAAEILSQLRAGVKKSLRQTGKKDEAKDGMDISLAVIDRVNHQIQFAGAFNPLLLIRDGEAEVYKADKMPIGVYIKDDKPFTNQVVDLKTGDKLYLFSDGFQDQFGGPDKRKFLPKKLRNLILETSHLSCLDQKLKIGEAFDEWKGNEDQVDDVLVIGLQV